MRAFIVRPFGTKQGIDFDAVERQLIDPALDRLGILGRTTTDFLRQGNIRIDMFQRLLTADLVIADVSIHNSNVFYELGVRHALRDKRTFLIRCQGGSDEVPFDLKTDRYLSYTKDDPGTALPQLIEGLRQTINSELKDSPVFMLLPELQVQDRSRFLPVPFDFREEVERAAASQHGGDLALLGEEAKGFEWESEGLRVVGRAQFNLRSFEGARVTWEAVRNLDSRDGEANTWLGTIYQRLGDLTRSDQALRRVLDSIQRGIGDSSRADEALAAEVGNRRLSGKERAEIYSLLGRNAKVRWLQDWEAPLETERRERALTSSYLEQSIDAYRQGFYEDLNHFYSGLNGLAMLTVLHELAKARPDLWASRFESDGAATQELENRKELQDRLADSVAVSIDAARRRLERDNARDIWVEISAADLALLRSRRAPRVANEYRKALAGAPDFAVDATRSQILLYQKLGILDENVRAALNVMPPAAEAPRTSSAAAVPRRVLLFTGHMIDAPGRAERRFPADKADIAKAAIKQAVIEEQQAGGIAYGIAGCASGGDILFHQVCEELGIPTRVFLALPRDQYVKASVAPAGPKWIEAFDRLCENTSRLVRVLGDSTDLPRWLQGKAAYTIWQRSNLWMLFNALEAGSRNVVLIALWNRAGGDGPGGTADMVARADERGAKTIVLNTQDLFSV